MLIWYYLQFSDIQLSVTLTSWLWVALWPNMLPRWSRQHVLIATDKSFVSPQRASLTAWVMILDAFLTQSSSMGITINEIMRNIINIFDNWCFLMHRESYHRTICLVTFFVDRKGFLVCVCLVCVLLDGAPVCLEAAGRGTASHFWLALAW